MRFSWRSRTGTPSTKRSNSSPFPECASRYVRDWNPTWKTARPTSTGEVAALLHRPSQEGRKKTGNGGVERARTKAPRHHSGQSLPEPAAVRKAGRRSGRCILTKNQHSAPVGLPDPGREERGQGVTPLHALRITAGSPRAATRLTSVRRSFPGRVTPRHQRRCDRKNARSACIARSSRSPENTWAVPG